MHSGSIKHFVQQIICWALLLQMINVSIDPPDIRLAKTQNKPEKKEVVINDVESVYEMISEGVFDTDVPEGNENDIEKNTFPFLLYCFQPEPILVVLNKGNLKHHSCYIKHLSLHYFSPLSPPPRLSCS